MMGARSTCEEWSIRCKHCYRAYDDISHFRDHLDLCHPEFYLPDPNLSHHYFDNMK